MDANFPVNSDNTSADQSNLEQAATDSVVLSSDLLQEYAVAKSRFESLQAKVKQQRSTLEKQAVEEFKAFYERWTKTYGYLKIRPSHLGVISSRGSKQQA